MLGFERVGKLIEKNVIEVAPLAYMRGRTLNNAFIILMRAEHHRISDENVSDPYWLQAQPQ